MPTAAVARVAAAPEHAVENSCSLDRPMWITGALGQQGD